MEYESEEEYLACEGAAEQSQPEPPTTQFSFVPTDDFCLMLEDLEYGIKRDKKFLLSRIKTITQEGLAKVIAGESWEGSEEIMYAATDGLPPVSLRTKFYEQAAAIIKYLSGGKQ